MDRDAEARRWLREAEWDLDTAQLLHRSNKFNASSFYSQQSAEKGAEAALYSLGEAPLGHSARELIERLGESSGEGVAALLSPARELDRHYIPSRYPNAHPSGTPHEAYDEETSGRALECAREILEFVRRFVEGSKRDT